MNLRLFIFGIITSATVATADTNRVGLIVHPVKDEATHNMLRALLDEKDPVAREEALRALTSIADPNDAGLVRTRVHDPHPGVRLAAVRAAAGLGLSLSPDELDQLARDREAAVRAALVEGLPSLAVPGKLDCFKQALADADTLVRRAAARAAANLPGSTQYLQERWASETDGATAAAMFRVVVQAADAPDRAQLLKQALANDHPAVTAAAIDAASAEDRLAVGELVLAKLEDTSLIVRGAAVRAVGRLKLDEGISSLLKKLPEADAAMRPVICGTLGGRGGLAGTQALAQRLADDPDLFTQRAAADGLLVIHTDAAREALVLMLESPRTTTRRETVRVLGQWKQPALAQEIEPLLDDSEPVVAATAAEALGWLQNQDSREPLLERLAEGPASVQERVAWSLGKFRAREAMPQLTNLLWSHTEALEATCAESLGLIGDQKAWPALHKMLYEMLDHGSTVRMKTIQALHRMGDKEVAPRMFQFVVEKVIPPTAMMPLPSYDATVVRVAAVRFLQEYGDTATGERLLKSFTDAPPYDLRVALAEAATQLTGRTYEPLPDETHVGFSVESLGPPPYQSTPAIPGVRVVADQDTNQH